MTNPELDLVAQLMATVRVLHLPNSFVLHGHFAGLARFDYDGELTHNNIADELLLECLCAQAKIEAWRCAR